MNEVQENSLQVAHLKSVRRQVLRLMYQNYLRDPLGMLGPSDFIEGGVHQDDLMRAIHYLSDSGLVELMIGYNPPLFAATRITAKGVDVAEDFFEFNRRFPPAPHPSEAHYDLPRRVEALLDEIELSSLPRDRRRQALRDVHYLREELADPPEYWRREVLEATLAWIGAQFDPEQRTEEAPSLEALQEALEELMRSKKRR